MNDDLDPGSIMNEHTPDRSGWCQGPHGQPAPFPVKHPCIVYRLADALDQLQQESEGYRT